MYHIICESAIAYFTKLNFLMTFFRCHVNAYHFNCGMLNILTVLICSSLLTGAAGLSTGAPPDTKPNALIICGWDEVFTLDVSDPSVATPEKTWSWKGKECLKVPETHRGLFGTTDDCKPVAGTDRILISSSGGGVALVERQTNETLFYARVGNAHSVEILPNNRMVAAASTNAEGNRVVLFDLARSDKPLWHDELYSGHGAVWDAKRQILWALGYDQLRAYHLADWDSDAPHLVRVATYRLPDNGGHDLQPVPGDDNLIVTTNSNVYLFDRDSLMFAPHPQLKDQARVKSVSIHPKTGQLAYTQAEGQNWWTEHIHFLNPSGTIHLSGERIYKVRWNQ